METLLCTVAVTASCLLTMGPILLLNSLLPRRPKNPVLYKHG